MYIRNDLKYNKKQSLEGSYLTSLFLSFICQREWKRVNVKVLSVLYQRRTTSFSFYLSSLSITSPLLPMNSRKQSRICNKFACYKVYTIFSDELRYTNKNLNENVNRYSI